MLIPHWHTITPTRGGPDTSSGSTGSGLSSTRSAARNRPARAAAAEACATQSGMTCGPTALPQT